jgi:rhodanese-related sulfurtransferase
MKKLMFRTMSMKKYIIVLLIGFGGIAANSCTTSATSADIKSEVKENTVAKNINAADLAKSIEKNKEAILIDVRTPQELAQGYIAGAINIDYSSSNFKQDLNKLDKSKPVYVYCRSGVRSSNTMSLLQEMGFSEVYNLNGGIIAWAQAGLPIKK